MVKTNVMRLLEAAKIPFRTKEYDYEEAGLTGVIAAAKIGMPPEQVFKTLTARGDKSGVVIFCIPAVEELDLKKAAAVSGNKRVELVHVKELLGLTGYIRGGCSPIGMKKQYQTYIDETALLFDEIAVSAGMRGEQIILSPVALAEYVGAATADLTVWEAV